MCPLLLRHPLGGWQICFSTAPFEMQQLIHHITVMLPYKNLHSTQLLHHCKNSDCLKASTFLQLISGCTACSGPPLQLHPSRCLSTESRLAALLVCSPRRIFMQRLHSCRATEAITTALAAGAARGFACNRLCSQLGRVALLKGFTLTTHQKMPGTNPSQVLSSSSWKEQSLPLTAPNPAPPQLLGWKGSHSLCQPGAAAALTGTSPLEPRVHPEQTSHHQNCSGQNH